MAKFGTSRSRSHGCRRRWILAKLRSATYRLTRIDDWFTRHAAAIDLQCHMTQVQLAFTRGRHELMPDLVEELEELWEWAIRIMGSGIIAGMMKVVASTLRASFHRDGSLVLWFSGAKVVSFDIVQGYIS